MNVGIYNQKTKQTKYQLLGTNISTILVNDPQLHQVSDYSNLGDLFHFFTLLFILGLTIVTCTYLIIYI
jgi:hypothetical protein